MRRERLLQTTLLLILALVGFCRANAIKRYVNDAGEDGAYAGILVTLSEAGITYARETLVDSVLQDLTPLTVPDVHKVVEWPIGTVYVELKNVTIGYANISKSDIDISDTGITVSASGVRTEVSLDWKYTYTAALIPFPIGDSGTATAEVEDGKAWLKATLHEHNGTLVTEVQECETRLGALDLELSGGQSWLYQWFVYAFQDQIKHAVESALTTQVLSGAERMNNFLLHLPRQLPVDDTSAINVTVVQDPILNQDFMSVAVKGQFVDVHAPENLVPRTQLPAGILCRDSAATMATIALSDYVISTASDVYYNAGRLQLLVDKLPQQSLLNTASWRFLIPQLYRKYPNEDMVLNISASSAPVVSLLQDGIRATTAADMTIIVLHGDNSVPVACVSLGITVHGVAALDGSNVTAEASLLDMSLELKWSEIGTFPVRLVQAATRTVLKDLVVPLLNRRLQKGFPLPLIPAVALDKASISYETDFLLICTDIRYTGGILLDAA